MLIVSILGYAASQELDAIKTRTKEGREVAKTRGVKFGRKRTYDKYQIQEILEKRNEGQGYGTIARSMGMNRGTVQKIINRENALVGIQ
jgi:DNA invertase Pin-like site-specific DNA recombinase